MSSKFLQNETGCVTFWDFAGQTVFQTTHQAFMSSKAVYLLVTDVSRPMTDIITDDDDCQSNSAQKSVGGELCTGFASPVSLPTASHIITYLH